MRAARLLLPVAPDRRGHPARDALVKRISGEFHEMPCLRLTLAQARRLFGLRTDVCQRVLSELVRDRTLTLDIEATVIAVQGATVANRFALGAVA